MVLKDNLKFFSFFLQCLNGSHLHGQSYPKTFRKVLFLLFHSQYVCHLSIEKLLILVSVLPVPIDLCLPHPASAKLLLTVDGKQPRGPQLDSVQSVRNSGALSLKGMSSSNPSSQSLESHVEEETERL